MQLYSCFRSSASYRVRIALNLKGLPFETVPVHLLRNGAGQLTPEYRKLNADGLVPLLIAGEGGGSAVLAQSLAIIEYLDEKYPQPALLPGNPDDCAYVRAACRTCQPPCASTTHACPPGVCHLGAGNAAGRGIGN